MAQITRYNGNLKPFADDSLGTERTVFGSETQSDTLDDNINTDFFRGWGIVGVNQLPTKQDFNALGYTSTALTAYLYQTGVPEWNTNQEYFTGAITNVGGVLYKAVADSTGENPTTDTNEDFWEKALPDASLSSGSIIALPHNTIPDGYLECDGSAISRTTYADLFALIGTDYGTGDGTTTFNIPDYRGEFLRGLDNGRGVDTGRVLGSSQADELKAHRHFMFNEVSGSFATLDATNQSFYRVVSSSSSVNYQIGGTTDEASIGRTSEVGGSETRPRNVSVIYCIKF